MLFVLPFCVLFFACSVILHVNPVKATLSLIGTFLSTAILVFLLGLEFYGLIYVIIYVRAVSVLFLFVVMTLNLKNPYLYVSTFYHRLFSFLTVFLFFVSLFWAVLSEISAVSLFQLDLSWSQAYLEKTSLHLLSSVLYTDYALGVVFCGWVLFVGMIGGILLTHQVNSPHPRHQDIYSQLQRTPQNAIFILD